MTLSPKGHPDDELSKRNNEVLEGAKNELVETLVDQTDPASLPLEKYSLGNSSVTISPQRGASIPSLILDGTEIFYNDPSRRNDPTKTIREGFRMGPQSGAFTDEQSKKYGYNLSQHGFLRDVIWNKNKIIGNAVSYQFETNKFTLEQFPHSFIAEQVILLGKRRASISLEVKNTGSEKMPFAPGHHTYYKVPPDQKENIRLSENMGVTEEMMEKWLSGEETITIPNPMFCEVAIPGTGVLHLYFDYAAKFVQLRSEKDKGHICIEPIDSHARDWEKSAYIIEPGEFLRMGFTVGLVSTDYQQQLPHYF